MSNLRKEEEVFLVNKYIEISDFGKFIAFDESTKLCEEGCGDKILMAAIVGLIEGNIELCIEKGIWKVWLRNDEVKFNSPSSSSRYIFLSIYNYIKSNNTIFNFIIRYFNLWHSKEHSEFTYDNYHKKELLKNFQDMIKIINMDLEKAHAIDDNDAVLKYKSFKRNISAVFKNSMKCNYI